MDINNLSILSQVKKFLREQLLPHESIVEINNSKLYFALQDEEFKPANIEGFLCLIVNREIQCLFIRVIHSLDYTKMFEIELYKEIKNGYAVLSDNFHSMEFPFGHLGINFSNKTDGDRLKSAIFYISTIIYESNSKSCIVTKNNSPVKKLKQDPDEINLNNLVNKINLLEIKGFNTIENTINYDIDLENKHINYNIKQIPGIQIRDEIIESHYNELKTTMFGTTKLEENIKKLIDKDKKLAYKEFDITRRKTINFNRDDTNNILNRAGGRWLNESKTSENSTTANSNSGALGQSLKHLSHMQVNIF